MSMPVPQPPMDFGFSETQKLLQRAVRQFAEKEIAPLAAEIDTSNTFPQPLWKKMGDLGLLGITVPESEGGAGLGYFEHVTVMEEISRASASVGLSYGAHSNLCVNQICLNGSAAQKKKFLPKLCSGEHTGALAMSETGAGSDVMGLQCRAEQKDGYFILNGSKMWITNGPSAAVLVVYARTGPDSGSHGITAFIVEKEFAGFSTAQKLDKLGMRGSDTCELVFENCRVPADNVLGEVNGGARVLMSGLDYERLILAAGPVGIMQACIDLVLPYVRERKQFHAPIGQFQLIQSHLADMYVALMSSRAWLYAAAQSADRNGIASRDAAGVILYASEQATQVALQTVQCLGGNGYTNDFPAGRLLRDAKLYEIGAGTSEIRRIVIGRQLFGMETT